MAGPSLLVIVGLLSAIEGTFGQGELEFSPSYGPFYPGCSVKATCVLTDASGRFTHWNTSGLGSVSCDIVLNHAKHGCSNQTEKCEPFTAINEDNGDQAACRTSFLNFVMSIAINGTFIQCFASDISDELIQSTLTSPARLVLQTLPSAPTLNPPLCSARDPASALVTVSWVDDGFNYTLDGAPINCTLQNPCQIDRSLQFSENRTFTVKAIDSPPSGCGKDLISEGSVLETTVEEVLPLEKPTLEVTLMRPEICNQDSNFKLLGLTASFSPLPPVLNLTDSGFDDIPCLTQYDLMINGTSVGSVDSECCVGDSCTCQMTVTTGLNITSEDSEFTVSLVSNAHFETEDCPPIRISDIREKCDIDFSFTFNNVTGTMATALCTDCNLTVYSATGSPMITDGSFPMELTVNYSYEATCQLTTSDDNCLQSVKYMGSLRADCGLMDWCSDCSITNCLSTQDGCTANFTEGFTVGATATVSGMGCGTTESLLCNNDGTFERIFVSEDEEGLSVGAIAAISAAGSAIVISIVVFEVTVTIAGSVVLHLEIKLIELKISQGGEVKHYISCTKKALFYMSPVGLYYWYYMLDERIVIFSEFELVKITSSKDFLHLFCQATDVSRGSPSSSPADAAPAQDEASERAIDRSDPSWWKHCCI